MLDSSLALFILVTTALIITPGPDLLYIIARSLAQGYTAGLMSVLGIHTGMVIHLVSAAVGLSALIASSPCALTSIKYAGSVYLIYLSLSTIGSRTHRKKQKIVSLHTCFMSTVRV